MNSNLHAYIEERYPCVLEHNAQAAKAYEKYLKQNGIELCELPFGFFTAKPQGDALIVYDLYTGPAFRAKKFAWKLFEAIKTQARRAHKNVLIGFSEHEGAKQELGRAAMLAAGFQKAFSTDTNDIYVRGVY